MQNVVNSIEEKEEKFIKMQTEMREAILSNFEFDKLTKERKVVEENDFKLILGDCVEEVSKLEDESIDYSFFSPPFGALYVFSNDPQDMSNVKNNDEFMKHFKFLVIELNRVIKSGRLVSIHMMQSTTLLGRDGYYSIVDFRGDLIRLFQECGFIFHAENMIRKDPKTAAIRTKNRQLMWGTTKKDSSVVRPGLADYILTFRKKGENKEPIINNVPFDLWCKIAEPVWIDIEEGDTLDYRAARSSDDERHITPTQLKPIEWCYLIWSNKSDTILSPFSGIASEGFQALQMDRKYIGIELKESYFDLSVKNLKSAIALKGQVSLNL
jgi:DNA modification methylase